MAGTGLLALLDDITALLDDVALMTRVAAKKTAGVIGDDLALNAQQVTGMTADRELPVIWAVAKGALLNKVILVPIALLISAWLPQAITPLLMIGGAYLCYEGFEKVWHKLRPAHGDAHGDGHGHTHGGAPAALAAADTTLADVAAFERTRIKGAVRTDFILSAEIVVIALGTMAARPIAQQVAALAAIGLGMTVFVYGLVAGIVKLDDLGLRLQRGGASGVGPAIGTALLRGTPWLMRLLSFAGTAAMFLVGGSIIAHGVPPLEHLLHDLSGVVRALVDAVIGIATGGVLVAVMWLVGRLRGR